ncbi:MAG: zeta toxin family protein [bacterium]|nr:zeta toxin family protein [bacterium]
MFTIVSNTISKEAIQYIKHHKKDLISRFADCAKYPPTNKPLSFFMAGSPGAGKTEFSKSFIKLLEEKDNKIKIVRIDADEIREFIPQFNGKNSFIIQPAAAIGVEKLFDYIQDKDQNVMVDSTFANLEIARRNISRTIKKGRKPEIYYLYQDPLLAWDFTKKREILEGRNVPKNVFIDSFFSAKENVNKIKLEYTKNIVVTLVIKNFENKVEKTHFNIDTIDSYLKIKYNKIDLYKALK